MTTARDPLDPGTGARLSDRLNPILVREIQQALNARAFAGIFLLALVLVVVIGLFLAGGGGEGAGRDGFRNALRCLAPLLFFFVPLQVFLSTRQEVEGDTADHLSLTKLRPRQIVVGKLLAATVQFLLYLSIFAPLIALTYLLRGVDIPVIALGIFFAFLFSLAASSAGIAVGSLSKWPQLRTLPVLLAILLLGGVTLMAAVQMEALHFGIESLVRSDEFWDVLGLVVVPVLFGVVLSGMVGAAVLTHPHENRSTSFRAFAVLGLLAAFAWIAFVVPPRFLDDIAPGLATMAAILLAPFYLIAATEDDRFSPRVRTLVPRSGLLASLSVPFLPGGGRGLIFVLLAAAVALAGALLVPELVAGADPDPRGVRAALCSWIYALVYSLLGRVLRLASADSPRGRFRARVALPFVIVLGTTVPLVLNVFRRSVTWSPIHILSPFLTVPEYVNTRASGILAMLVVTAIVLAMICLPSIVAGVRETLSASRERRRAS